MSKIKEQYLLTFKFMGKELKTFMFWNFLVFVGLAIISYVISYYLISIQALEESLGVFLDSEIITKYQLVMDILANNMKVSIFAFILGCLALGYVGTVIITFSNAIVLGKAIAIFKNTTYSPIKLLVFGILPHGIFEFFAMFLTLALSTYITNKIIEKMYHRRNFKKTEELKQGFKNVIRTFILVVVPIVLIAALIEGYITIELIEAFV